VLDITHDIKESGYDYSQSRHVTVSWVKRKSNVLAAILLIIYMQTSAKNKIASVFDCHYCRLENEPRFLFQFESIEKTKQKKETKRRTKVIKSNVRR